MKNTKESIFEQLLLLQSATISQLSELLHISEISVRHHLISLEAEGVISSSEERHGVGRPRFVYRLTDKTSCLFPRSYDEFAKEVLTQVRREFGEAGVQRVLEGRADELVLALNSQLDGLNCEERVKKLVKIICEKGYLAEARKLKDGSIRLRQRNCPTEKVATQYPHVCEQELRAYREALACEVTLECRIVDGATMCEFKILPASGKRALPILAPETPAPAPSLNS